MRFQSTYFLLIFQGGRARKRRSRVSARIAFGLPAMSKNMDAPPRNTAGTAQSGTALPCAPRPNPPPAARWCWQHRGCRRPPACAPTHKGECQLAHQMYRSRPGRHPQDFTEIVLRQEIYLVARPMRIHRRERHVLHSAIRSLRGGELIVAPVSRGVVGEVEEHKVFNFYSFVSWMR